LGLGIEGRLIEARLVAELKPRQLKLASRVMDKGGAFVQTAPVSTHRQALVAEPGEHVLVGLRYGAAWNDSPLVEARLTRAGEAVVSIEAAIAGHLAEKLGQWRAQLTPYEPPAGEVGISETDEATLSRLRELGYVQ
jgi:hypothetical protein